MSKTLLDALEYRVNTAVTTIEGLRSEVRELRDQQRQLVEERTRLHDERLLLEEERRHLEDKLRELLARIDAAGANGEASSGAEAGSYGMGERG